MIYDPLSVVVVPFPFTDSANFKKRPAVVVSSITHQKSTHHVTLLMITSAKNSSWESDYLISALKEAGLTSRSIIRQKLFTIDARLIIKSIGKLSLKDEKETIHRLMDHFDKLNPP